MCRSMSSNNFGVVIIAMTWIACMLSGFVVRADIDPNDGGPYLFDLLSDPYEDVNLFEDENYQKYLPYFQQRIGYWTPLIKDPEIADGTNKSLTFERMGGIGPWLESDFEPISVEQIYFPTSSQPNIVFVLVDDWGWNDAGLRSTYMNWTTPTYDRLSREGVTLTNYYSQEVCTPSRGALLTGRYPLRLGLWEDRHEPELPLNETTLAQEMKSAGYRTYMVGKWHLGYSTTQHLPSSRGFDYYYGFLSGFEDYWNKTYNGFFDLRENEELVTDEAAISDQMHSGYLFESKVEEILTNHNTDYENTPMFLYYAMQLIHAPWTAPEVFQQRCSYPANLTSDDLDDDEYLDSVMNNYCALNLMLDEALTNLTCTLERLGYAENTVLVIASDNGGEHSVSGNSYPFKGHKGSYFRGGNSASCLVHSKLLPEESRGLEYHGLMHVTDWLPTLMSLATNDEWTGSLTGADIDGVNMWDAIIHNGSSPEREIVHYCDGVDSVLQFSNIKYVNGVTITPLDYPLFVFESDLAPENGVTQCEDPSLIYSTTTTTSSSSTWKTSNVFSSMLSSNNDNRSLLMVSVLVVVFVFVFTYPCMALKLGRASSPSSTSQSSSSSTSLENDKDAYLQSYQKGSLPTNAKFGV